MKAVYSFISTPFRAGGTRTIGGFADLEMFYCSWTLSVLNAKKHIGRVELVTDEYGKELLSRLRLPFDKISTELEGIDYHHELWAIGKIHTYLMQEEPFLHIDHDVYLWQKLPARFDTAQLICQNTEHHDYYDPIVTKFSEYDGYKPTFIQEYIATHGKSIFALNMGVFGGQNIKAIQEMSEEALKTIAHPANADLLHDLKENHGGYYGLYNDFNLLVEQYYAGAYAVQNNIPFEMILEKSQPPIAYTHLISESKRQPDIALILKKRCIRDCPDYYALIQTLLPIPV